MMRYIYWVFLLLAFFVGAGFSPCSLYINNDTSDEALVVNESSWINATIVPPARYTVAWIDFWNNKTLQNNTSISYFLPPYSNVSRLRVLANNSTWGMCSDYALVRPYTQSSMGSNFFASLISDWASGYSEIIFGVLSAGIAYGLTQRIGHAAIATSVLWLLVFFIFGNNFFILMAIPLFAVGLVLTYANI